MNLIDKFDLKEAFHQLETILPDNRLNLSFLSFLLILIGIFSLGFSKTFWLNYDYLFYGKFIWLNGLNITFSTLFIFTGSLLFLIFQSSTNSITANKKVLLLSLIAITLTLAKKDPNIFNYAALTLFILSANSFTKKHLYFVFIALTSGTILQILLATFQLITQNSTNFILFKFLGEPTLTLDTKAISKITIQNLSIIRPYATTNHPNLLGALILLTLIYNQYFKKNKFIMLYLWGILITFSANIYASTLLNFVKQRKHLILFLSFLFIILTIKLLDPSYTGLTERIFQFKTILNWNPSIIELILGTKNNLLNNLQEFKTLPWENQPIHNHYLNTLYTYGITGLSLLIYFSYKFAKQNLTLFITLLPILFFDHYFLTIANGILLLGIVYILATKKIQISS